MLDLKTMLKKMMSLKIMEMVLEVRPEARMEAAPVATETVLTEELETTPMGDPETAPAEDLEAIMVAALAVVIMGVQLAVETTEVQLVVVTTEEMEVVTTVETLWRLLRKDEPIPGLLVRMARTAYAR